MFTLLRFSFGALIVLFLVAPLVVILPLAFTSSAFLTYPIPSYSMRWFEELITIELWQQSIINSLIIGGGATILATVIGTSAALALRRRLLFSAALNAAFLLPMIVPAVVLGVGMQLLFGRLGLVNNYLSVIIAHVVVALPFVLVSVSSSLQGIDSRIERAALSLGAPPWTVFRRITLPLAMPGVVSGAVLAFATSLDEVVLTLFVAGPNQRTLARQMFSSIRENISPAIAAAALVIIVGTVAVAFLAALLRQSGRRRHPAQL